MISRKVFLEGFFAPFTFFVSEPIRFPEEFDGGVEEAWEEVGQLLSGAIEEQGRYIEQTTGKKLKTKYRWKS